MNLCHLLVEPTQHFGLINSKDNWPEPSAHLHPSFPDNQHITVPTPKSIFVAVEPGDKMLFLRVGGEKSLEGILISEITPSLENIFFWYHQAGVPQEHIYIRNRNDRCKNIAVKARMITYCHLYKFTEYFQILIPLHLKRYLLR